MAFGAFRGQSEGGILRFAAYLNEQYDNAEFVQQVVALGQTYFAIKTRQQELQEDFESMNENRKRLTIRNELK